jgi:hypothetical protein
MRTQTLDDNTAASDPGRIRLSHEKLRRFHPELYQPRGIGRLFNRLSPQQEFWLVHKEEHLLHGDSRAALVVSLAPLLIAAYTDELDCVALLRFDSALAAEYNLNAGDRLLTVNLYARGTVPVSDLENGPASYHRYSNFAPMIAEFVSDDITRIELRKSEIEEAEWQRTRELAEAYLKKNGPRARDGRPLHSERPAA